MNIGKVTFKLPKTVRLKEAKKTICDIVRHLNDDGILTPADIPQLHRMATAYNTYLQCNDIISEQGVTMENLKGETVKRPEVNIMRESWSQYLEIAKEYGLTAKSKGQLKGSSGSDHPESPADDFFNKKK